MAMRKIVLDEIRAVAAAQDRTLAPLTDDLPLHETGLDSLCFAILVSQLEDATGRDPFSTVEASEFPQTVGQLIRLYELQNA